MNHNISDIEFKRVCEVFSSSVGLHFSPDRRAMLGRNLATAAKEFEYQNINEFIAWLVSPIRIRAELETLAPFLTNPETYFWREAHVFNAFSQDVIPGLVELKKNSGKSINIWCAGCSSGEEAYSIAISLYRTIPDIKEWNINILATDINTKVLDKARAGVYGPWSFRNSPLWLRNRYMNQLNDKEYEIVPEIKEMVTFSKFNLIQENYISTICKNNAMDIIFCRNVMMYFTKEWAGKAANNFYGSLSDQGWLVVASCELSSELFPDLAAVNFPGAVLYRKTNNVSIQTSSAFAAVVSSEEKKPEHQLFQHIQPVQPSSTHVCPSVSCNSQEDSDELLLKENKVTIRTLADQGRLEEALSVCNMAINDHKLSPGLYYMRASILQELDKNNEAIKSLKQALYVDPDYIMGHFTLGNIFLRQGIIKSAKRYFSNTLHLLNSLSGDDIPSESEGLSARYIRSIIHTYLHKHEPI